MREGGYEGQVRETYSLKLDPFSLYTFKITGYHDIINIIPTGVVIILLSTVASFSFGAWLVQYVVIKGQNMPYGILMPLRRLGHDSVFKKIMKNMLSLFLVMLVTSILDFVLTNIAVAHISNTLELSPIRDFKYNRFTLYTILSGMAILNFTIRILLIS